MHPEYFNINKIIMYRIFPYIFSIILIISLSSCFGTKNVTDTNHIYNKQDDLIEFYYGGTMNEILDKAKKENKLVFVDMTADWCAPCKIMDEEVFTYKPLYEFVNDKFISYKLDVDNSTDHYLAFLYNVKTIPTIMFLDQNGRVLVKEESAVSISGFMELAKKALSKNQQQ
jgi:thiol:disulfide interchange protein